MWAQWEPREWDQGNVRLKAKKEGTWQLFSSVQLLSSMKLSWPEFITYSETQFSQTLDTVIFSCKYLQKCRHF